MWLVRYPLCGVLVLCHVVMLHRQLVGQVDVPDRVGQVCPVSLEVHACLMPLDPLPESMGGQGVRLCHAEISQTPHIHLVWCSETAWDRVCNAS